MLHNIEVVSHCRLDIYLRAFWGSFKVFNSSRRHERILLTGATGYVGAFILNELLENTEVCFSGELEVLTYTFMCPSCPVYFKYHLNRRKSPVIIIKSRRTGWKGDP